MPFLRSYCTSFLFFIISDIILPSSGLQIFSLGYGDLTSTSDFVLQRGHGASAAQPPSFVHNSTGTPSAYVILAEMRQTPPTYGRVVYRYPVTFRINGTVPSFQIYSRFTVLTSDGDEDCTEGLTFFIAPNITTPQPDPTDLGRVFGLVGNDSDYNRTVAGRHLFAVEFDGKGDPDLHDPTYWSHFGIDINSLVSEVAVPTNGTSLSLYRNSTLYAWMEYDNTTRTTTLWAASSDSPGIGTYKPSEPTLLLPNFDLSSVFLDEMYVGVSAGASTNCQNGTIFVSAWNFTIAGEETFPAPSPVEASVPQAGTAHQKQTMFRIYIAIPAASVAAIAVLICTIFSLVFIHKRRQKSAIGNILPDAADVPENLHMPRRYSYRELKKATLGFSKERKLGEGGFSCVYKGILRDGTVVAVKRLKKRARMESEFAREVKIISQIKHRNLLQLEGWCYGEEEAPLLVYTFMPNGSLDNYIFKRDKTDAGGCSVAQRPLNSDTRYRILTGVAAALEYLHDGALMGDCVLHRDVKAANVLLTETFEAKLGDFGLARLASHDKAVTVTAAGTAGYVAPEILYDSRANDKSDVYSFGALALEVACGRSILNQRLAGDDVSLVRFLWSLQRDDKLMKGLDPALHCEYMADEEKRKWRCVLHLGMLCCSRVPAERPSMRQAHSVLKDVILLPFPSPPVAFSGTIFSGNGSSTLVTSGSSSSTVNSSHHSSYPSSFYNSYVAPR